MGAIFDLLNFIVLATIIVVSVIYFLQRRKSKKSTSSKENKKGQPEKNMGFEEDSVQNFLDFEKIYNDMIIRDKGTKYTSVIHCSGINYDLMSGEEKIMVEEAFIELLNFIQFPIQIYVQTRKVDLKDSLKTYGSKITTIETEIRTLVDQYQSLKAEGVNDRDQMSILEYEIRRKQNLYEYALDLKKHIERMNISGNVLQYKYYIVITYHIEELGLMTNFTESEVVRMAHDELQTRCQGIIGALAGCNIDARMLDSNGLAELLYMAFNRDDAELCRLKDNMEAGFYRLYSTTEDAAELQHSMIDYDEDSVDEQLMLLSGSTDLSRLLDKELSLGNTAEK